VSFPLRPSSAQVVPVPLPVPNALAEGRVGVAGHVGRALDLDAPELQPEEGEVRLLALAFVFPAADGQRLGRREGRAGSQVLYSGLEFQDSTSCTLCSLNEQRADML